ncbi:MAG: hypothetical protein OXS29_05280 [bacterium]|nr:hypothetical protein [bacterium]MDE0289098.1 hypothetical protein [bacterium]MDE0440401.1 hypothetical protein [bacterium]
MRKWAADHGLPGGLVFDDDMSIVNRLGVSSSPAAVGFIRGRRRSRSIWAGGAALDDLLARRIPIRGVFRVLLLLTATRAP